MMMITKPLPRVLLLHTGGTLGACHRPFADTCHRHEKEQLQEDLL